LSIVHTIIFLPVLLDFVIDVTIHRGRRDDYAYHNASLHAEECDSAWFSSTVSYLAKLSRWGADCEIYLRPRHIARFARRGNSAYRMKRAPKLQLKLSVSIRARVPRGKGDTMRKNGQVIQEYLNENIWTNLEIGNENMNVMKE